MVILNQLRMSLNIQYWILGLGLTKLWFSGMAIIVVEYLCFYNSCRSDIQFYYASFLPVYVGNKDVQHE